MKSTIRIALGALLSLTLGQIGPPVVYPATVISEVVWEKVLLSATGGPTTVLTYDLAILDAAADMNVGGVALSTNSIAPSGYFGTSLATLLTGRKPGTYAIQVRARDTSGNIGAWSADKLLISWDGIGPAAPKGLKLKLQITIGPP